MNDCKKMIIAGKIGVIPTDTIYGIVGQALNKDSVERIYAVRKRNPSKPMIILISSLKDLELFGINLNKKLKTILSQFWPGKTSVVLQIDNDYCLEKFTYLHRGTKALAFRLPQEKKLSTLISQTGPLVAPSANIEGLPPATTTEEAKKYFENKVDFYVDGEKIEGSPSRLIKIEGEKIIELRK